MLRLNENIHDYFKKIEYTKAPQFDWFYMCAVMGIHAVLKNKDKEHILEISKIEGMMGTFTSKGIPDAHAHNFPALVGLMLEAEFCRKNVNRKDEKKISRYFNSYLNFESNITLTQEGADLMSAYCYRGFEIISSNIGDSEKKLSERAPSKESFLDDYYKLLKEYIS